ncbi:MAG: ABC transporter permease [Phycisphaerae bacterium]
MALPLSYNWKNLLARKTTTLLTCLVIAAVVGVFTWMLGFQSALSHSLSVASDGEKLIVLKQGSTSETNSAILPEDEKKLAQLAEVAVENGEPLRSQEMIVQVSLPRKRDGGATHANVAVRGVSEAAFRVHRNVRLVEGRMFTPGLEECIVGLQARKQFAGLEPAGGVIHVGYSNNRGYKIVGYFSADGGPMESEVWAPVTLLLNAFNRTMYSSVSLRLKPGADAAAVIERIEGPGIELTAQTEPQYWQEQSKYIRTYLIIVGSLVAIMSLAAVFAIANTLYSTTAGRTREFAMLRTIGFSRVQILTAVILESLFLALLGGAVGCLGCEAYLALLGNTKDMFGASTFTTLGFEIHLTPAVVGLALALVSGVAVVGGLFPAYRASRLQPVEALREA